MKRVMLLLTLAVIALTMKGQDVCEYFPADCPETGNIESAQDSEACIRNYIVPQEVTMQNRLREQITNLVKRIAREKNWDMYELTEEASGVSVDNNTLPVPYALRRPHQYTIRFDLIVNQDSLRAWQDWYKNDLASKAEQVVETYKNTDNSSESPYVDSTMYYGALMGKYLSDHAAEYQKALLSNDAKYLKMHDEQVKKFQDKIAKFSDAANRQRDENYSSADSKTEDLQAYKKRKTLAYRGASTVRISFVFNEDVTPPLPEDVKVSKPLSVPNSSFGAQFVNPRPDETSLPSSFLTTPCFAFILFGKWITRPGEYGNYKAVYFTNRQAIDKTTPKKIPCDKIQTLFVGIEGQPRYVNEIIETKEIETLSKLIDQ